jgi:initiation factor 1A
MLGNGRLEAQCIDGIKRLCHIRGKMRKKVWVNAGDVVLVGLREFQDAKADVILKYQADEARSLKAYGELPESSELTMERKEKGMWGVGVEVKVSRFRAPLNFLALNIHTRAPLASYSHTVRVNEADAFADEENQDEYFDFEDVAEI